MTDEYKLFAMAKMMLFVTPKMQKELLIQMLELSKIKISKEQMELLNKHYDLAQRTFEKQFETKTEEKPKTETIDKKNDLISITMIIRQLETYLDLIRDPDTTKEDLEIYVKSTLSNLKIK